MRDLSVVSVCTIYFFLKEREKRRARIYGCGKRVERIIYPAKRTRDIVKRIISIADFEYFTHSGMSAVKQIIIIVMILRKEDSIQNNLFIILELKLYFFPQKKLSVSVRYPL